MRSGRSELPTGVGRPFSSTARHLAGKFEGTIDMSEQIPNNHGITPLVDGYNSQGTKTEPPSAAVFNKGATTEREMQEAADRRREHSSALSRAAERAGEHDEQKR
jgi:hypothetical protein